MSQVMGALGRLLCSSAMPGRLVRCRRWETLTWRLLCRAKRRFTCRHGSGTGPAQGSALCLSVGRATPEVKQAGTLRWDG